MPCEIVFDGLRSIGGRQGILFEGLDVGEGLGELGFGSGFDRLEEFFDGHGSGSMVGV